MRKRDKSYKKIKRVRIWSSLFVFFIFFVGAFSILAVLGQMLFRYAVEERFINEYQLIKKMADVYDSPEFSDKKKFEILKMEKRAFAVKEKDGKYIYRYGNLSINEDGGKVILPSSGEKINVYADTIMPFIYPKDNDIKVNPAVLEKIYDNINADAFKDKDISEKSDETFDIDITNKDSSDEVNTTDINDSLTIINNKEVLLLPYWISIEVNDGQQIMYCRANYKIDILDVALIMLLMLSLVFMTIVLVIYIIVKTVSTFISQKRIFNVLYTDEETNGYNWFYLRKRGEKLIRSRMNANKNYSLIAISFVGYRNYCMCHSIQEGQKLLRKIYRKVRLSIDKKEICAQKSSANFVILLRYSDEEELKDRINSIISELETIDENHKCAFHIGVDLIPSSKIMKDKSRKKIDLDNEYNNASAARETLSESDDSGVVFYDEKLLEEQRWLDKVQEYQKKAIEKEEFLVYYQPKYNPKTNTLRGAEALVRWESPELGFVSPGRFIPIFEKNGFITQLDHYMIEHVSADQKRWKDAGLNCVPVSVNVSRAHFIEKDLAEQICDMVDKAGTPHELIEIELTESAFFDDKKAIVETIRRLKEYGFSVSMDDFGSGYSSLNSLKDMPLDVLKLDAEFFRGDNEGERGEIVVSEAINLAKKLNMKTVAEGVEIKEQVDFLVAQECDMIQGYYYAKPMPAKEYEERLSNQ